MSLKKTNKTFPKRFVNPWGFLAYKYFDLLKVIHIYLQKFILQLQVSLGQAALEEIWTQVNQPFGLLKMKIFSIVISPAGLGSAMSGEAVPFLP